MTKRTGSGNTIVEAVIERIRLNKRSRSFYRNHFPVILTTSSYSQCLISRDGSKATNSRKAWNQITTYPNHRYRQFFLPYMQNDFVIGFDEAVLQSAT